RRDWRPAPLPAARRRGYAPSTPSRPRPEDVVAFTISPVRGDTRRASAPQPRQGESMRHPNTFRPGRNLAPALLVSIALAGLVTACAAPGASPSTAAAIPAPGSLLPAAPEITISAADLEKIGTSI